MPSDSAKPQLPDYVLDPNAVLYDTSAEWCYQRIPDYSRTREDYEQSKPFEYSIGAFR